MARDRDTPPPTNYLPPREEAWMMENRRREEAPGCLRFAAGAVAFLLIGLAMVVAALWR